MLHADKCTIIVKLVQNGTNRVASVVIWQEGARMAGFTLKTGPHGLFLDPPMYETKEGKWRHLYYDEIKPRYKKLQEKVIEEYEAKTQSASFNDFLEPQKLPKTLESDEIDLSDLPF